MAAEKRFENKIKDFLKRTGCWYVKYWGGGGYTKSGVPDLLICCGGLFLGVEVKAAKGKPSDLQIRELRRIRDAGGIAILLYPKDMTLFENLIYGIKNEKWMVVQAIRETFEERIEEYEQHCE